MKKSQSILKYFAVAALAFGASQTLHAASVVLDSTVATTNLDGSTDYTVPASVTLSGANATQYVNSLEIGAGAELDGSKVLVINSGSLTLDNPYIFTTSDTLNVQSGTSELQINVSSGSAFVRLIRDGAYSTSLVKSGEGTLFTGNASSWGYSGDTIINAGMIDQIRANILPSGAGKGNLVVNGGGTAGLWNTGQNVIINGLSSTTAGGVVKDNYGSVSVFYLDLGNNDATASFAGSIQSLNLGVIKSGNGTQTFSGVNTYGGDTQVNAGKLVVNGSLAAGNVNVASGATLGGTGTVGGATTVSGIIAPGDGPIGTLNIGNNVTWNGAVTVGLGTTWVFKLGTSNASDLLNITGDFTKGTGSVFCFDFQGASATGTYNIVDWTGSTTFSTALKGHG